MAWVASRVRMSRIPAWLAAAGGGHVCGCPRCPQLAAALTSVAALNTAATERVTAARISDLERQVENLEQQLAALRRRKGAA